MTAHPPSTVGKSAAISVHPLFPTIVALWFAALLGLGSFMLPPALLERMAAAIRLPTILPSAAAPLGMTARLSIAAGATVTGAVLGWIIARSIANAQMHRQTRRRANAAAPPSVAAKRPISAREELGADRFDDFAPVPPTRRRTLTVSEEDGPSEFLQSAPLPGGGDAFDAPYDAEEYQGTEALELHEIADAAPPLAAIDRREAPILAGSEDGAAAVESESEIKLATDAPPPVAHIDIPLVARPLRRIAEQPLDQLGTVELVERLALSLQQRRARAVPAVDIAPVLGPAEPEAERAAPMPRKMPAALRPLAFDDLDSEEDGAAMDAGLAAFRGLSLPRHAFPARAEDNAIDHQPADLEQDEDGERHDTEGCHSLRALDRPFAPPREYIRIDEPEPDADEIEPMVVFPSRAAMSVGEVAPDTASNGDGGSAGIRPFDNPSSVGIASIVPAQDRTATEHALKDALATLQRMSGAA